MAFVRPKGAIGRLQDIIDTHRCIKMKFLRVERELQDQKWFPYRFISPYRATLLFVQEYERYYLRAFAQHFDRRKNVTPVNRLELHKPSRLMTQAWTGRQRADALGMPYGLYFEFFDNFLMRRTRKHLPRMNQIEGSEDARAVWPKLLATFKAERAWHQLMNLDAPQLHNDNFKGLPTQIAFRGWAMETIKASGRSYRQALEVVSFRKCLLPPDAFLAVMDEDVYAGHLEILEADRKHGRLESESPRQVDKSEMLPSCFGLVGVWPEDCQSCHTCMFAKQCQIFDVEASRQMSNDRNLISADDLKRKFNRERQAEHRRKKKEASSAT